MQFEKFVPKAVESKVTVRVAGETTRFFFNAAAAEELGVKQGMRADLFFDFEGGKIALQTGEEAERAFLFQKSSNSFQLTVTEFVKEYRITVTHLDTFRLRKDGEYVLLERDNACSAPTTRRSRPGSRRNLERNNACSAPTTETTSSVEDTPTNSSNEKTSV